MTSPPTNQKYGESQTDGKFFDSTLFYCNIDVVSSKSKGGTLRSRSVSYQCSTFVLLWIYSHRPLNLLQADNEYIDAELRNLWMNGPHILQLVAASHHGRTRTIKRANWTLRLSSGWLLTIDLCTRLDNIVPKATCGKNVIRSSKLAFSFELPYSVHLHILDTIVCLFPPLVSKSAQLLHKSSDHVILMLRQHPRDVTSHDLVVLLPTYIRRDGDGWLGLAKNIGTTKDELVLSHDGHKNLVV